MVRIYTEHNVYFIAYKLFLLCQLITYYLLLITYYLLLITYYIPPSLALIEMVTPQQELEGERVWAWEGAGARSMNE
ncbi:Uncharacterised protein [Chryseobacterium gleum]|uniref:Uncharacterized protein n=2 Tax=Chryseobacterium gleum TaxID=250 RepID=A0A448B525_CHRGE|nr:hypothetical protein HMPREF0204_10121 [Chryseobacterium gleum ATCC 35910]VEE09374.1 Uncharacterised protein [Chryseobacterium gleum]